MAQGASIRPAAQVVVGSGILPTMGLVTSGMKVDHTSVSTTWQVNWNMNGTAGSGIGSPAGPNNAPGLPYPSMSLNPPPTANLTIQSPLVGGNLTGVFVIEGCNDNEYFVDLGVSISGLASSASGVRLINIAGPVPDWQRLRFINGGGVTSSGVFDVWFGARGN